MQIMELSTKTGAGMDGWLNLLRDRADARENAHAR
jgi:hypothetical protein